MVRIMEERSQSQVSIAKPRLLRKSGIEKSYVSSRHFPDSYYHGVIVGNVVEISDTNAIKDLQNMGSYGSLPYRSKREWMPKSRYENQLKVRLECEPSYSTKRQGYNDAVEAAIPETSAQSQTQDSNDVEKLLVVVPDSDEEESPGHDNEAVNRDDCTVAEEPLSIRTTLTLTMQEVVFLTYGLGCLFVNESKSSDTELSWRELWRRGVAHCRRLPALYAVYHHFRVNGWVPKCGLSFGVDYVLYKDGPEFYHSSFAVKVVSGKDRCLDSNVVLTLVRSLGTVQKDLLVCFVSPISALDMTEIDTTTPDCIRDLSVQEFHIKRGTDDLQSWLSKKSPKYIVSA